MSFLADIQARAAAAPKRIAFCELEDSRISSAIAELRARGLAEPVEVRDPSGHERFDEFVDTFFMLRESKGITLDDARVTMQDPLFFAAMMVRHGLADGCVAGAVRTTADVLRAGILCVGSAPGIKSVSSAFYMVVPPFRGVVEEVLTFTDASVIPQPTSVQLADIAEAAALARAKIVGDEPRVAFLSFSTRGSARTSSTNRVRAALMLFRERCPDICSDGELQVDAALVADIAHRKAPDSRLAGTANVLVFPTLDAGNIAYKLVQRLAHADAVGPVLQGLAKPCNDLSRGASVDDIVNVACITALQAVASTEQNLPRPGATV